jgi:hypothetical protein
MTATIPLRGIRYGIRATLWSKIQQALISEASAKRFRRRLRTAVQESALANARHINPEPC